MKIKEADIVKAIEDSKEVELSEDKKSIRRAKNTPLPDKSGVKKRDVKASDKEETKKKTTTGKEDDAGEESEDLELDFKGNPVFDNKDFENPYIFTFKLIILL
jgi:hypothetical protein